MTVLPLGWTSNSYRGPVTRPGRSRDGVLAKLARRGAATPHRHGVGRRSRRDIVVPMGFSGSAYGRRPDRS